MKKLPPEDLDLGFSEFLGERKEEIKQDEDSLEDLFNLGKYRELSKIAEAAFDSSDEAVLWWIRAQIKLNEVPLSILSAPFERVEKNPDPKLESLIKITAEELGLLAKPEESKEVVLEEVVKDEPTKKTSAFPVLVLLVLIAILCVTGFYFFYSSSPGFWSVGFSNPNPRLLKSELPRATVDPLDLVLSQIDSAPTQTTAKPPKEVALPKPTLNMTSPVLPTRAPTVPSLQGQREVLVDTVVLDRPSIKGEVIARLTQGAIVEVLGEAGTFYRIRSKMGADGFVIKQDVGAVTNLKKTESSGPVSPFSREAFGDRRD
jgi:hypothetical protein